ncbi:MAG: xanthine phosphoribosyltransferase [Albidovulum sp.]|nr:xanthine phosphoribosyltransferase [Albidovulum sp.]
MSEGEEFEKSFLVSWDQLHRDARALAWHLDNKNSAGYDWRALVAIARGGMAPAMIIARELDIRTVDTISVKSYDHQSRTEAEILKYPDKTVVGDGEGILIIDDLVDTGKTLEVVRSLFPSAHYATIYAKPMGRPQVDTYITEVSQDTWIFFPWDTGLKYVKPVRMAS